MYPFCLPLALPRQHFIVIFASVGGKKGNTASIVLPGRHFWLLGQSDDAFEGRQTHHTMYELRTQGRNCISKCINPRLEVAQSGYFWLHTDENVTSLQAFSK